MRKFMAGDEVRCINSECFFDNPRYDPNGVGLIVDRGTAFDWIVDFPHVKYWCFDSHEIELVEKD